MVIHSSRGQTDCEQCRFFQRSNKVFVQHVRVSGERQVSQFVSLPILVAVLASTDAAREAILRIREAQALGKAFVDLTDLEDLRTLYIS